MIQSGSDQPELLGDLVAHRLLAFDAVRLLERRHVVPAERPPLFRGDAPGVGDQPVDERDVGTVELALADEGDLHVLRHEDLRRDAGRGAVGRDGVGGVARRRHRERRGAEIERARDGGREPARLEGVGRVQRLVLDVERGDMPRSRPSRRAWMSGVQPSPSVIGVSPSKSGISSRYRHIVGSRAASDSRRHARAASRS